ncbi:RsmB/NOP family class I SAM-dependent RNA methyltransferase [Oceanicella actignis]|uniref:16S rRNA (Cytosine967-C5)-methyltransferase n=1 Tax=Oceanicella actignis TaxID=1189325 RepID=A0A1M7RWY2_9RHOB|nr:RsmB/NOP family class I SAM-dependent RNA methyltransferase [Oceanicella actignis]SES99490.1 16S rRNA (cytosine967-C5)-methyltransferase [Oceanicella actignis]SHN50644.1 16S rRNA (cytosine967-C5)-methyltransferase [Oceanicella actignis]
MTPAARLSAAMALLDAIEAALAPAPGAGPEAGPSDPRLARGVDRLLARWGRENRYAGARDRAAVADLVYDALRRRRSLAWRMGPGAAGGRALVLALLAEQGLSVAQIAALCDGGRFAPAPLSDEERARLAAPPPPAPAPVRLDFPDWLEPELRRTFGPRLEETMATMRARAPLDLRVNALRATPEQAIEALRTDGVEAAPGPLSPWCLRVEKGARRLRAAAAYRDGLVEIQDAASQAAALMSRARPGEQVLDFCAGGGGKALALAAMTGGPIDAHDADPRRMADLPARARRAGARVRTLHEAPRGRYDLVFVDAPCSGSGAWRRNPDAKWALTPAGLEALRALQARVLRTAARNVAGGGRLLYATCSLLRAENRDVVEDFLAEGGFALEDERAFTPRDGGDGFYAALLRRVAQEG